VHLRTLTWAFTLFGSVRVLAYPPTIWAIVLDRGWPEQSEGGLA
jgi:hypothetical protein